MSRLRYQILLVMLIVLAAPIAAWAKSGARAGDATAGASSSGSFWVKQKSVGGGQAAGEVRAEATTDLKVRRIRNQ